jgi:hypothetical protein
MTYQERHRTAVPAGEVISDHNGRALPGRRRRSPATTMNSAENGRSAPRAVTRQRPSSPARGATPLRRWSVAELRARAVATPRGDGISSK